MKHMIWLMAAGAVLTVGAANAQTPPAAPRPAQPAQAVLPPVAAIEMMQAVMPSTDFERSKTFYVKGMGLTARQGANPKELVLSFPGGKSNIMLALTAATAPITPGRAILQVPDMKIFVAGLAAAGFAMQGKVNEMAQYHIAQAVVKDPDGNSFEVIARLP